MEKKKLAYQVQGDTTTYYVVSVDEEQVKGIIKDITSVYGYKVMWPNNNENKLRLRNNQIVDSNYAMEINEKDPAAVMAKTETWKWRVALAKKAMTRFSEQPEERPYVEKCVDKKRTLGDSEEKLTDTGLIVDYRRKDINPMNLIHTATNKDGYVKESAEMVNVRYKMLSFPYLA